ncbi:UNVERIFIED_CONTAM: putative dolichyl pyrophosphate Man9GlcNAc2 alpha-1,3-glucosyltransferase [Sesamum angustifolium]|uniref:Alpha-1,3-glucosyltransferase n=1 Tax=Sesamum angustifolium TaxID=2727405 RepID=A0AAW2NLJ9_9LAMI
MFGDYEAQRHWMEITVNLPVKDWYRNSSVNDLGYWGLDYPPLTAYQSYFHGILLKFFDPASVSLFTSRGYESYIGALFHNCLLLWKTTGDRINMAWHTLMILLNPCIILIDHGHFQYNCISLGLTLAAVAAILSDRDLVGSMLFCLALNHKQMSAYYAPAFFGYLLGKSLRRKNPILEVLKLGFVVLGTFALVWWPYLHSMDASLEVHSCVIVLPGSFSLSPFERGIYEDYVANFWCATSVVVKWKRLFSTQLLKLLSLTATVSACIPSMIQLMWSPTKRGLLQGLLNCSLSFYLFSFQVHEKSILLPLLPASFLALEEPFIFSWLMYNALLSMFPLLRRDGLVLPYAALYGLFILLYHAPGVRKDARKPDFYSSFLEFSAFACSLFLHIIYLTITPPDKYPFLFEAVIMIFCFSQFVLSSIYLNTKQWALSKFSTQVDARKKSL